MLSVVDPPATKENAKVDAKVQNSFEMSRRGYSNNNYEIA
jgi:hypothetical protein